MLNSELERLKSCIRNGHTILSLASLGYDFDNMVLYGVRYASKIRIIDHPVIINHTSIEVTGGTVEKYKISYYSLLKESYVSRDIMVGSEHVYYDFDTKELFFINDRSDVVKLTKLFKEYRGYFPMDTYATIKYMEDKNIILGFIGNTGIDYFPKELSSQLLDIFNKSNLEV